MLNGPFSENHIDPPVLVVAEKLIESTLALLLISVNAKNFLSKECDTGKDAIFFFPAVRFSTGR